jgi:SNW domain-containing protein 1
MTQYACMCAGYTIPLDKRMANDGTGLQDVTINDKYA